MKKLRIISKLLLWKYYRYLRYHWARTVTVMLLPLFAIYIVITFTETFEDEAPGENLEVMDDLATMEITEEQFLDFIQPGQKILFHVPSAVKIANDIMQTVSATLKLKLSKEKYDSLVFLSIRKREQISDAVLKEGEKGIAIDFIEVSDKNFIYKIRQRYQWKTYDFYVSEEISQLTPSNVINITTGEDTRSNEPYFAQGFVAMQYCLDSAYVNWMSRNKTGIKTRSELIFEVKSFVYPEIRITGNPHIHIAIAFTIILASVIILSPMVYEVITDKVTGNTVLMEVFGIRSQLQVFPWIVSSLLMAIILYLFIVITLTTEFRNPGYPVLASAQFSFLYIFFLYFFIAQIAFALFICNCVHKAWLGIFAFSTISMLIAFFALKLFLFHNGTLLVVACIFPSVIFIFFFMSLSYHEMLNIPYDWNDLTSEDFISTSQLPVKFLFIMLFVDIIIYSILAIYIYKKYPGKHGYPWKITHIFKRYKSEDIQEEEGMIYDPVLKKKRKKQKTDPTSGLIQNIPVGDSTIVNMRMLRKKYDNIEALKGINLHLNEKEVTALLGNNRSGKSTVLAILLGLTSPTGGAIDYKGSQDFFVKLNDFRKNAGYCPQDNRIIPYFTVREHLLFYGQLKERSKDEINEKITTFLELMEMTDNGDDLAMELSAEHKRKLNVCIALVGGSQVLLLDEPTLGLEPKSAQKVWETLKKLKEDHCIILTTNNMTEATEVGDRIAVLNNGVIVCNGTPKFLEKAFAIGYELLIHRTPPPPKDPNPKAKPTKDPITNVVTNIKRQFPGTKMYNEDDDMIFNIPSYQTSRFPALFKLLEAKKGDLRIESIHVNVTSLDSIYMKIGGDSIYDFQGRPLHIEKKNLERITSSHRNKDDNTDEEVIIKISGKDLMIEQFLGLLRKKGLFTIRNWLMLILRVALPTLIILLLMIVANRLTKAEDPIQLTPKFYPRAIVLLLADDVEDTPYFSFKNYFKGENVTAKMVDKTTMEESTKSIAEKNEVTYRKRVIYGFTLETQGRYRLYYNKFARHGIPVAINAMFNAILFDLYNQKKTSIICYNDPVEYLNVTAESDLYNVLLNENAPVMTIFYLSLAFLTIDLINFVTIPTKAERVDGFKHVQFLSGVKPALYWLNTIAFDFILTLVVLILRMLIIAIMDLKYNFISFQNDGFTTLLILLVIYIISGLYFEYFLSFMINSRYVQYTFFIILNIVCTAIAYGIWFAETDNYHKESIGDKPGPEKIVIQIVSYLFMFVSPITFSIAFFKFLKNWRHNQLLHLSEIEIDKALTKKTLGSAEQTPVNAGEAGYKVAYLQMGSARNPHGILLEVIFLALNILIYLILIYIHEFDRLGRLFHKKMKVVTSGDESIEEAKTTEAPTQEPEGESEEGEEVSASVIQEIEAAQAAALQADEKTEQERTNPATEPPDIESAGEEKKEQETEPEPIQEGVVLISNALKKVYKFLFVKKSVAVEEVSFVIQAGEVFGIIGPTDAGKSQVFKMMTGEVSPSSGESYVQHYRLSKGRYEYFSKIGYCPQSDSFLKELTGKEILILVATLRGVPGDIRLATAEKWALILGIDEVFSDPAYTYNGSETRKLCTAMALIGEPNVVLLDEPASGIDPMSRKALYTVLSEAKNTGQGILVSMRSMQECEAICDRLMILIDGKMKFVGSPDQLKQEYAQAFTLIIILKDLGRKDTDESRVDDLLLLNYALQGKFQTPNTNLISETRTVARYEIVSTMTWTEVFTTMETLKKKLKFMKEYHLSEKSLEDVYETFKDAVPK